MLGARRLLLATAVLGAVAAAGCGSSQSAGTTTPTESDAPPTAHAPENIAVRLRRLVLQPRSLPASYRPLRTQMHPISLAQETSNDSRRAASIERATYLGGYQAGYARPGIRFLFTAALAYTSAVAVHRVDTDPGTLQIAAAQVNGRLVAAPHGAPGADPVLIEGSLPYHGRSLPVVYFVWREGRFAYAIFIEGGRATLRTALRLAAEQDAQDRRMDSRATT